MRVIDFFARQGNLVGIDFTLVKVIALTSYDFIEFWQLIYRSQNEQNFKQV